MIKNNVSVLDALKAKQAEAGFLTEDAIIAVAKEYGMAPSEVYETATFYSMLHVGKKADHVIEVCGSTCCDAAAAKTLIEALSKELGVKAGETTADGKWMLRRCECLGRCGTAPNVMIDNELITGATAEAVINRIKEIGA